MKATSPKIGVVNKSTCWEYYIFQNLSLRVVLYRPSAPWLVEYFGYR